MSNVIITATGAAILNPNESEFGMQMLFLNEKKHKMKITTRAITPADDTPNERKFYLGEQNGSRIDIKISENGVRAISYENESKKLDGNIVDLDKLHGTPLKFKGLQDRSYKMSLLSIPKAKCYTEKYTKEKNEFWMKSKVANADGVLEDVQKLLFEKKVTHKIGAHFELEEGGFVTVKTNDPFGFSLEIPYKENWVYYIDIDNDCEEECGIDFPMFYKVLDGDGLEVRESIATETGYISDEVSCNPVKGGGSNNRSFEEIYEESR